MNFKEWLILSEVKKASDIAKELLGNDINQIKSIIPTDIPEKLQSQLLPIAAYYYKQQLNINTLKQDIQDYANLVKLNKMQIITVNDDLTINNDFKSYLHWTEIIHGKKYEDKVSKAPIQGDLSDQEIIANSTDNKIKIYKANSVNQCIILGKGQKFCISQPANSMFQSYRDTKISTFYFVYDNTRTDDHANDKDKFAEIIINKKTELSDYDFINLLFYAKDQNKITTLLGKEKIAQLFANDSEAIEHLLEDAKYSSQEHIHKIVEVYARYKSKISDDDVHILLTYGGHKIIKSIMERRPDLSKDYLYDELNDIESP